MTKVYCDNCPWTGTEDQLCPVLHLIHHVERGGTIPHGECPDCGALCYEVYALGNVETETYAVLSTAHITQTDSAFLNLMESGGYGKPEGILFVTQDEYHYRVKVTDEDIDAEYYLLELGMSKACVKLITSAIADPRIRGIIFDRDGIRYERFPSFDW